MTYFEGVSAQGLQALAKASDISAECGSANVQVEHLLVALMESGPNLASEALTRLRLSSEDLRQGLTVAGRSASGNADGRYDVFIREALARAQLNHRVNDRSGDLVTTGDILLALLDQTDGPTVGALETAGVRPEVLRPVIANIARSGSVVESAVSQGG